LMLNVYRQQVDNLDMNAIVKELSFVVTRSTSKYIYPSMLSRPSS